jgi:hypothetical protein
VRHTLSFFLSFWVVNNILFVETQSYEFLKLLCSPVMFWFEKQDIGISPIPHLSLSQKKKILFFSLKKICPQAPSVAIIFNERIATYTNQNQIIRDI